MNTLQDTLSTLSDDAAGLANAVMETSRKIFDDHGEVSPGIFAMPWNSTGGEDMKIFDVPSLDDKSKPAIWAGLRKMRQVYPVVAFVSEVWTIEGEAAKQGLKVMPRDHPDKKERVMLQMWAGSRAITFSCDIKRNPSSLGEWRVFFDSMFPPDGKAILEGAMMEGENNPTENN